MANETENSSVAGDNDITLKLKNLYISETTEKYAKSEHDIIARLKCLTISDVEDIDEDLVESLKNVLNIDTNEETNKTAHVNNYEFEKCLITVLLTKCEFPRTWNPIKSPPYDKPQVFMDKVLDKDEEIEDRRQFKWDNFVLQLILIHELTNETKFSEAYAKIRELKYIIDTLQKAYCNEPLFMNYFDARHHIIASTEAYILLKKGFLLEAKKVLKNIVPVSKMTNIQRSCILGTKANVFMEYGFQSTKKSIEIIKEAIKLDEFQAQWHYIFGKALGIIRRFNCYKTVDREEINALEKALELDVNASYVVHLAQTYREHERVLFLNTRDIKNTSVYSDQMFQQITASKQLMRKALELSPNCPHINIRCALGILKLPLSYRRNLKKMVKNCIDIAFEKAPNNRMLHHVIGVYYTKMEENLEKAEKHLEIAARQNTYGASIDLIRFRYRQNKEYDILKSLQDLLIQYTELERKSQTLAQIGSYYLFKKRDLVTAVEYYMKIINEYPQCETMKMHKVLFLRMSFPVNLYNVVSTEINLHLSNNNDKNSTKILRHFLVKILTIAADAIKESEKQESSLVEEIIKESEKFDKIIADADRLKSLTREGIENHIAETQKKKIHFKPKKTSKIQSSEAKTDEKSKRHENEKNRSVISRVSNKRKETNKKFIVAADGLKSITHEGIETHIAETQKKKKFHLKPKKTSQIQSSEAKTDEKSKRHDNEKNRSDISRVSNKHKETNKKFTKERFGNNQKGLKRSHSVSSVTSDVHAGPRIPKFVWDVVRDIENPKKKQNSRKQNPEVSCDRDYSEKSKNPSWERRNSSFYSRNDKGSCSNVHKEHHYTKKHGDIQGTTHNIIRSRSTDGQVNTENYFNNNFGGRNFSSTSSLEQRGSYKKRSDSASSGDSEFTYGAISSSKLHEHDCKMRRSRNRGDESRMSWNDGCQGNRSRDSSVDRLELECNVKSPHLLYSQELLRDKIDKDVRGQGRGRRRGRGSADRRVNKFTVTDHNENVESLASKITNCNSFLPNFSQNKEV